MSLRHCYNEIRRIHNQNLEPFESVELVSYYRQYWKPDNVRIILLAESHVFTSDDDRRITLLQLPDLPEYPTEYAKFVYCLAYGERHLTENVNHPANDGTPQYWKLFYSCIHRIVGDDDFHSVLSVTPYPERLNNKIELLKTMKRKGIWLVDASIVALYGNGRLYDETTDEQIIRTSWACYVGEVVRFAKPEHIICIGKGVARVLENGIRKTVNSYTVMAQPNARLQAAAHMALFKLYGNICNNHNDAPVTAVHIPLEPGTNLLADAQVDTILSRRISPELLQPDGQYTIPRSYGVYYVTNAENRHYRCGNHPVRERELKRQYGEVNVSVMAIFINIDDCRQLALLLNQQDIAD